MEIIQALKTDEWLLFSFILFGIFSILGLSELIRKRFNKPPESTRQFIHICVGIIVSICPFIFKVNYQLITLSVLFIIINTYFIISNKVSSMNSITRVSYGTIYFPFSILLLTVFFWDKPISYFLSILVLTFADPIAATVGRKSNTHFYPWKDKKSLNGLLAMFSVSFLIILLGTDIMAKSFGAMFYMPFPVIFTLSIFTAACATLSELISYRGTDNLSIPLVTFFSYEIFLINYTHGNLLDLCIWLILSIIIFSYAYKLKSVSISGAIGGFLVGIFIFGSGGWVLISPLVFFFISSSFLSIIKNKKPSQRDVMQILANGGAPTFFALSYFFFQDQIFLLGFLGSLSASTADTWATEIGFLSKKRPYLIFTSRQVKKGVSGSISLLGTFGSIAGALSIGLISFYIFEFKNTIALITLIGSMGSFIDTLMGRYIQGKFYCTKCNKDIEQYFHCGAETILTSGFKWIDNNLVNFIASLTSGIIIMIIYLTYG